MTATSRHLPEWRLACFLLSLTMIVTVYFQMWKVIRILAHPLSEMVANRLRVCVRSLALEGASILYHGMCGCQ